MEVLSFPEIIYLFPDLFFGFQYQCKYKLTFEKKLQYLLLKSLSLLFDASLFIY